MNRDRLTCSGGVISAHLAAYLVDQHVGRAAASKSLRIMIINDALAEETLQPGVPIELSTPDPLVRKALNLMQQSLAAPTTVEGLASRLEVSRRKLERHFREALGITPAAADRRLRLAQARFLLEGGKRSVTQIAAETGFCDASHLIRVFREAEGVTPEAYRQQTRALPHP